MTKPLILNEPAFFQLEEMIEKLLKLENVDPFSDFDCTNKEKKAILYKQMLDKLASLDCVEARCVLETIKVLLIEIESLASDISILHYDLSSCKYW
ncbi:MAG: hypothetical protein ACKN9F_08695 [Methylomonas sp.]